MNYTKQGEIVSISDVSEAGAGKKLTFRIDTKEQYNNLIEFEMFKGADYVEHVEKFKDYNKVGDTVSVEFNLKTYHWTKNGNDKIFTSLSAWKVNKVSGAAPLETTESNDVANHDESEELPF